MSGTRQERPAHQQVAGLLARYELGRLTEEERRRFERHVLDCDECFAELERGSVVAATMREHAPALARILAVGPAPEPVALRLVRGLRRFFHVPVRPRLALAVASVFVLAVIGGRQIASLRDPARLATYPREEAAAELLRGAAPEGPAADPMRELLDGAGAHFDLGNFADAERYLRAALTRDPTQARASYLLGLCRVRAGAPGEAVPFLEKAAATADTALRPRATWALANARLGAGDVEGARRDLERIAASGDEWAADARRLVDRLPR